MRSLVPRVSRTVRLTVVILVAVVAVACATLSDTSSVTAGFGRPLGLDLYRPEPADNPTVRATVTLGRRLFSGTPALARPLARLASTVISPTAPSPTVGPRPSASTAAVGRAACRRIVNRAWGESFFWDGRIATLEEQVLQPIVAELEMDLTIDEAVERHRGTSQYRTAFRETFGRDVNGDDLARALAAYVRTIQAGASPFDRYVWGEPDALSPDAQAGLHLFQGRANCTVLSRRSLSDR